MSERLRAFFWDQPIDERWNRVIEVPMIGLLAFCPLAFGAVHAWSEQVVIALAAVIGVLFLGKLLAFPGIRFVWTWAYIPLGLFVLIAAVQLLPLPPEVVEVVSPETTALKTRLLEDVPNAEEVLSSVTLSLYPHATKQDLRLVLAVAMVFVVAVNVYREPQRIKRLLAAIAAIGGGVAVLALAQDLAGNGKIYWTVPTYDQAFSGPFVNHSHYGQFMNLSMGAALALLFVLTHEAFMGRRVTPARVAEYLSSPDAKGVKLLLAMIVIGAATVFVSLTRGGMVSMLIAGAFTTLVLSSRQSLKGRGWVILMLAMAAFVCVLWVGFEQVYDRLASLRELDVAQGGRLELARIAITAWSKFPLLGTGLGTYPVVYPMFDHSDTPAHAFATHPENEYVQAIEETGALGFGVLLVFGAIIWVKYARSVNVGSVPIRSAVYGLGFGLLAILIHSLTDFGQHLPANALLTATTCGLLVVLAGTGRSSETRPRKAGAKAATLIGRATVLPLVIAVFAWALWGANKARVAQGHWDRVLIAESQLESQQWLAGEKTYDALFEPARAAVAAEPDNVHYRHWLGVYKWLSLTPYMDPNTGVVAAETLPWVRVIVDELHQARPHCPTFGATLCVAGQLERFVLNDPAGQAHIELGYELAPCEPVACYALARVLADQRDIDEAFAKLRRAVELDGTFFAEGAEFCLDQLHRPDLALQLAGADTRRLTLLARLLGESDEHTELADEVRQRIFVSLKDKAKQDNAGAYVYASLANLYRQRGEPDRAIEHYRIAVKKDYSRIGWHYALARLLADAGRIEEAMHEAEICLRLRQDYGPARRLIEELSVRPVAAEKPATADE